MKLALQTFDQMLETMAASVQGAAAQLIDVSVGSVLRALLQANASIGLWMQWLMVEVLQATRLATSSGVDCDSFGADFGFARLPAVAASGSVTFTRFSPTAAALVPVGSAVATADNALAFLVTGDAANPAFSAVQNGYVLAGGVAGVTVPVAAVVPGAAGNVQGQAISLLATAMPGVDTVTNAAPLTGGLDAEPDAAFKRRFGNFLASLARATPLAVGSAVAAIQQGLSYSITENADQTGAPLMGHFVVTVDDGTGAPPTGLLATVQQAVDAVRPVGTSFAVQPPVVTRADVAVTLELAPGAVRQAAAATVEAAIAGYIAGLPLGATLAYTRLAQIAYDASAMVTNLSGLTLNGGMADLAPAAFGVIRAGTLTIS